MTYLNRFVSWVITSSADPEAYALTVKGIAVGLVPYLFTFLPLIGVHPSMGINDIPDALFTIVDSLLIATSAIMTVVGAVRKVYITFVE